MPQGPFASSVGVGRAEPEWASKNKVDRVMGTDKVFAGGETSDAPLPLGPDVMGGDLSTAPKKVDLLIVGAGLSGAVIAERCSKELGMTSLILDVTAKEDAVCRLLAVSEDGEYITVHLLEPNVEGVKGTIAGGVRTVSLGHYGPCTALERSPFVPDVYLSVGDWSFNLWKDGVSTPLFVAPFAGVGPNARLTCGAWSPTRPGVLFIGRSDGGIDVWDLLDRSHEPSTSFTVAGSAVLRLSFTEASGTLSKAVRRGTPRHAIPHSSRPVPHSPRRRALHSDQLRTPSAHPVRALSSHARRAPSARPLPSARCTPLRASARPHSHITTVGEP